MLSIRRSAVMPSPPRTSVKMPRTRSRMPFEPLLGTATVVAPTAAASDIVRPQMNSRFGARGCFGGSSVLHASHDPFGILPRQVHGRGLGLVSGDRNRKRPARGAFSRGDEREPGAAQTDSPVSIDFDVVRASALEPDVDGEVAKAQAAVLDVEKVERSHTGEPVLRDLVAPDDEISYQELAGAGVVVLGRVHRRGDLPGREGRHDL